MIVALVLVIVGAALICGYLVGYTSAERQLEPDDVTLETLRRAHDAGPPDDRDVHGRRPR